MNIYYRKFNNRFEENTYTNPMICSMIYILLCMICFQHLYVYAYKYMYVYMYLSILDICITRS